jgi:hypothetical protein
MAARIYDPHTIRAISVRAHRDPRTVIAALEGRASPIATAAVRDAIRDLGLDSSGATRPGDFAGPGIVREA